MSHSLCSCSQIKISDKNYFPSGNKALTSRKQISIGYGIRHPHHILTLPSAHPEATPSSPCHSAAARHQRHPHRSLRISRCTRHQAHVFLFPGFPSEPHPLLPSASPAMANHSGLRDGRGMIDGIYFQIYVSGYTTSINWKPLSSLPIFVAASFVRSIKERMPVNAVLSTRSVTIFSFLR